MTNIPVNSFSAGTTYPKYVTDETLRQVVTTDEDGNPALRVVCDDVEPDLSEIEERIGEKTEEEWDNSVDTNPGSVISILKNIDTKLTTPIRPPTPPTPPPEPKILSRIDNIATGQHIAFSSFVDYDIANPPTITGGGNIFAINKDNQGHYELLLYYRGSSGSETVTIDSYFLTPFDEIKYYSGTGYPRNGYALVFTDGTFLELYGSRANSYQFGVSTQMILPDDMIDFSPLFS